MNIVSSFKTLILLYWARLKDAIQGTTRGVRVSRRLRFEPLEHRQMFNADPAMYRHNFFDPEDVNDDGAVTALDALVVINGLNRNSGADTEGFTDVNHDGFRSPLDALVVINRLNQRGERDQPTGNRPSFPPSQTAVEVRSIDGTGNNVTNIELGSTGEQLLRVAPNEYEDGVSVPVEGLPSTREISNVLSDADPSGNRNDRNLSAYLYVWGQFLDHDIDLSLNQEGDTKESLNITVPTGDPQFDPTSSGTQTIPFTRSAFDSTTGTSVSNPRQQTNSVTSFIDGSMVYGSDAVVAANLRTFESGLLKISEKGLLPTNEDGEVMAGDIRAAENISLTALQALFVREHNRIATQIATKQPGLTDEEIYQKARAVVIAEIQSITYNEFLPSLLGNRAISRYTGYDSSVNPAIANEFSTAAFRFGHSSLNEEIEFFSNDGTAIRDAISLSEAFFNPSILEETGIDSLLKYEASTQAQEIDLEVVESLRNLLFGAPGSGGLDLVALNIQRGRDHGLADYNATRVAYGLSAIDSFSDITSDVELQQKLESLYKDVNNVDLWVGLLAEDHVAGASVGELTKAIIVDQFERLRDGDRFWYESTFTGASLRQIQQTTLADIIQRNTDVTGLQKNVFFMQAEVTGRVIATLPASTTVGAAVGTGVSKAIGGGAATLVSSSSNRMPLGQNPQRSTPPRDTPQVPNRQSNGLAGVTLELLDEEGAVIDTTITDQRGNYRFNSFAETGIYKIRIQSSDKYSAVGEDTLDVAVTNGSTRLRDLNFKVLETVL